MTTNIINFPIEGDKRRVPVFADISDVTATSNHLQYIIELEHENLELQQQVCALHHDLMRERAVRKTE